MDIFAKILNEATRANKEQDLPDLILEKIQFICDTSKHSNEQTILQNLFDMLVDYEPYGDVGCGNESYSTADIQRVVDLLYE